ncbi:hypothetical protein Tco_0410079 [Tanacetum coccineum]
MNPQKTQQVVARDEKWVPSTKRVKIIIINVRLETTMQQKEETFQVVINIIMNFTCFKAFTISAVVPEIFMQQFWYTIKKVKEFESYEFLLANKKYIVNAEVFRKILDVCRRVEGKEFTPVQDDDDTLTFLTDLGYKGPLYKHTIMFVDHMHQPWRTLAVIINKCLSGKTASNDKLRKYRIDILWGMFYRENVDYPELIWEGFAFQIDHKKEKKSRRETLPFPRFTKVIINHFLKQHKSLSNLKYQHYHIIKDDGIVSRLKFVRIGEDYQEYGLAIPDVMLNNAIKQLESYQMFIKYSTKSKPEPAKKRIASRRVVKKKVIISDDDNIILDPDVALELGKSISITEAEKEEAARQVHATHARIVTEFVPEPTKKKTGSRNTRSVIIQDTQSAPKSKLVASNLKLKGIPSLTPEEQLAADIMQALKESKKPNKRQPGTRGSGEGIIFIPGVPNESTVVFATSSEGIGSEQESEYLEEELSDVEEINWSDFKEDDKKKKDDVDNDKSIDLEMTNDEETDDEVLQGKEKVNYDEDEEMTNDEAEESRNGDEEEETDAAKADAENTKEAKDDYKKVELPPTSSSLSISSGFGDQFLKLSFDTCLIGTLRVAKLEKDVFELKKIDHSAKALATLKSQVPTLPSKERSKLQQLTLNKNLRKVLQRFSRLRRNKLRSKRFQSTLLSLQTRLYYALMEALMEDENAMDKGVTSTVKDHKRKHDDDDDENPPARLNQNVVRDDDQPQDTSEPKTAKTPNPEWFKQHPRPATPDLKWNKRQVILGQPE